MNFCQVLVGKIVVVAKGEGLDGFEAPLYFFDKHFGFGDAAQSQCAGWARLSGALTILAMACGSEPFGYDYLYPLMPPGRASVRDGFVRSIWSRLAKSGEVISRHEA